MLRNDNTTANIFGLSSSEKVFVLEDGIKRFWYLTDFQDFCKKLPLVHSNLTRRQRKKSPNSSEKQLKSKNFPKKFQKWILLPTQLKLHKVLKKRRLK